MLWLKRIKQFLAVVISCAILFLAVKGVIWITKRIEENRILKQVIARLSADSRIAEVLVTKSTFNEETGKIETTIKFLEYDSKKLIKFRKVTKYRELNMSLNEIFGRNFGSTL